MAVFDKTESLSLSLSLFLSLSLVFSLSLSCSMYTCSGADVYGTWISYHYLLGRRVPGLPIGNCADISNNLVQRVAKVSAIDVTAKTFFERLYLVSGLRNIAPFVTMPLALSVCVNVEKN